MFSTKQTPAKTTNSEKISLEFIWQGNPTYWTGKIRVIDIYINKVNRYSVHIPEERDHTHNPIALVFNKTHSAVISGNAELQYLIVNQISTIGTFEFKAGVFTEHQGNTMHQNWDGSWERSSHFRREDSRISLDFPSIALGNHYKIIVTHSMKKELGRPFWQGQTLKAVLEEAGPCKKQAPAPAPAVASLK